MRKRLASAARCAIKNAQLGARAIKQLEEDLMNGPMHCFGNHSQCSPDFCRSVQAKQQSTGTEPHAGDSSDDADVFSEPVVGKCT